MIQKHLRWGIKVTRYWSRCIKGDGWNERSMN
jgi:hypothetical protein